MTEPLASPTLAQLYLAQGHPRRARATLQEVLEDDPYNGHALVMLDRLHERARPDIYARFIASDDLEGSSEERSFTSISTMFAGELELRWSVPASLPWPHPDLLDRLEVVVAIARLRAGSSMRYTSLTCSGPQGRQRLSAPLGPASAAVALVAHGRSGQLVFLAVADPLSW